MRFRQRLERALRDVPASPRCRECASRPETWVVWPGDPLAVVGRAPCPDCGWAPVVIQVVYADPPQSPENLPGGWEWQG